VSPWWARLEKEGGIREKEECSPAPAGHQQPSRHPHSTRDEEKIKRGREKRGGGRDPFGRGPCGSLRRSRGEGGKGRARGGDVGKARGVTVLGLNRRAVPDGKKGGKGEKLRGGGPGGHRSLCRISFLRQALPDWGRAGEKSRRSLSFTMLPEKKERK